MNLITHQWLLYQMTDGTEQYLSLIEALSNPEVVNFALPRADFQGAAYQFSIGLLQTAFPPVDDEQWHERYDEIPKATELEEAFNKVVHAFNVTGDGPLFMQDFEGLEAAKPTTTAGLLIEAPGGNTLKMNTDHFVKRGIGECLSVEMAVLALFTLQINAPSGGQGHRVGLRGGGPLTTLIVPQEVNASLWQKLWLNVTEERDINDREPDFHSADVFPWLEATKTSAKKDTEVYAADVHPLHMYWAMPRRIRLNIDENPGICQLSGRRCELTVRSYRTQNYGYNYSGSWRHPLTPYRWDPKKPNEDAISTKGQPGGITYNTWDTLTFTSSEKGQSAARVVEHFYKLADDFGSDQSQLPRLWVFGYDMKNMKARCWYSVEMPLFNVPSGLQDRLLTEIKRLQELASQVLWQTRTQIKTAWFSKPGDAEGDFSYIDLSFWQKTESAFFSAVASLVNESTADNYWLPAERARVFLDALTTTALEIFDDLVLSELPADRSMADRIGARRTLKLWLFGSKSIKDFKTSHQIEILTKEAV